MEVCHRRELCHDRPSRIEPTIERGQSFCSTLLVIEHAVNIANQLVREIIHNMHILDFPELRELLVNILVEFLKMVPQQLLVNV